MPLTETLYEYGLRAGRTLLPGVHLLLPDKLRKGLAARQGLLDRVRTWAEESRGSGPVVWFHAPSVGEGLQTAPVMEALKAQRPELKIFYTYFSPSAEGLAERLPVDHADYLPFDIAADMREALELVRPLAMVFGKADVWPTATRVAAGLGVRLALVSATLSPGSSRLRGAARAFLRPAYRRLDAVGAISADDAERLEELGVPPERIRVTGDARFDQVKARGDDVDSGSELLRLMTDRERPTLVGGSTWSEGERKLVEAFAIARARHPSFRLIIAAHEPTADHLSALDRRLAQHDIPTVRLSQALSTGDLGGAAAVVVDRVGILAELYAAGDFAYVGGGFGARGIHSVLEPAVLGTPMLFGPRHANAREAAHLVERGGAVEARSTEALAAALICWLDDPAAARAAGRSASEYVEENLGAAARNAQLVAELIEGNR